MKTLPPVTRAEWLLSFDFDGTLIDPEMSPSVPREFFETITLLRDSHQALWGINTGRSLIQTLEGMNQSAFPFWPDYIIAREREIYTPNNYGRWVPVRDWNKKCDKDHKKLFRKHKRLLESIRKWLETETSAMWSDQEEEPAGIIASSPKEMYEITVKLRQELEQAPALSFQRNDIYLRFSHEFYHKGSALAEVGRLIDIPVENRFTIGDGHNDLDMLDLNIVGKLACPANACEDVKTQVSENGGYVAKAKAGLGTVESLQAIFLTKA